MLDGKCRAFLLDTGSSSCNICGATPTQMEDVKECQKRSINQRAIKYGMSSLHLWMRCAEFFLHIGYRLKVKLGRIPKDSPESETVKLEKERMQTEFYDQLNGLRVDYPNPNGGNTNNGPTCRRLFRNYKVHSLLFRGASS